MTFKRRLNSHDMLGHCWITKPGEAVQDVIHNTPLTIEEAYKLIGCSLIEVHHIKVNGMSCQAVCDEEGLYNSDARINRQANVLLNGQLNTGPGPVGTWLFLFGRAKFK